MTNSYETKTIDDMDENDLKYELLDELLPSTGVKPVEGGGFLLLRTSLPQTKKALS